MGRTSSRSREGPFEIMPTQPIAFMADTILPPARPTLPAISGGNFCWSTRIVGFGEASSACGIRSPFLYSVRPIGTSLPYISIVRAIRIDAVRLRGGRQGWVATPAPRPWAAPLEPQFLDLDQL